MSSSRSAHERNRTLLFFSLGIDNFGSGLFLPLALLFMTTVIGLNLPLAGVVLMVGTGLGLLAPLATGHLVDHVGARAVVVCSQLLQAAGFTAYLLATGPALAFLAALLVGVGTQAFYSALIVLIGDVSLPGMHDRSFATVEMIRSAAFGAGALTSSLVLGLSSADGLRLAVMTNILSFVGAAVILFAIHPPGWRLFKDTIGMRSGTSWTRVIARDVGVICEPDEAAKLLSERREVASVWSNRPYLAFTFVVGLLALSLDFFLIGMPIYVLNELHGPIWLPGVCLALLTVMLATLTRAAVAFTRGWTRTLSVAVAAALFLAWAGTSVAAGHLPATWTAPWLLGSTIFLAAGTLLFSARAAAIAEAAAPRKSRGRHLAVFQYAYAAAALMAPLLVSTFQLATWLPWAVVGAASATALAAMPTISRRLPEKSLRPISP